METSDSATEDFQLRVRRSDGFIVPWNRSAIVKQLLTETKLGKEFYDVRPISKEEAEEIAIDVEKRIFDLKLRFFFQHQWLFPRILHLQPHFDPL